MAGPAMRRIGRPAQARYARGRGRLYLSLGCALDGWM